MCGIVGIVSRHSPVDGNDLLNMRESLHHRGPDDSGEWFSPDGRLGLGHRRLSIIDLSHLGRQPMLDSSEKYCIVFNGEVYNYRELRAELIERGHVFRSATDTEVVLEAYREWGTGCIEKFIGMFAFCLCDMNARRLFFARDRAGEKPLFYSHTPGRLVFASELKAIMADPGFDRLLDPDALEFYLAYGYVPGEMCILSKVKKLLPGWAMTYDLDTDAVHGWSYWKLPEPDPGPQSSAEDLAEELDWLLKDSVKRQLTADAPIGILLSGGIDSSLVTAMAASVSSTPLRTFTISFPGHGQYDEGPYARMVADHFATQHTEMVASATNVELLPKLAAQYDEPLGDSSIVPSCLVCQLIRPHAKVALGGDGGDELFGGYPHYGWLQRQEQLARSLPPRLRQALSVLGSRLPQGFRGRNYLTGLNGKQNFNIAHVNLLFDSPARSRLLNGDIAAGMKFGAGPEEYRMKSSRGEHSVLRQASEADFRTTMVDDYLVKLDRASMMNGLEIRTPWLDHRIVEFAFRRVPDVLKIDGRSRKVLVRRLAKKLLPGKLDLKRKQGFSIPLGKWFKSDWGDYMESILLDGDPGWFNKRAVEELISGQRKGFSNAQRLFALTMLELWRREYRIRVP